MSNATTTGHRDVIEEMMSRIAELGGPTLRPELVAMTWRAELWPLLELRVGERLSAGLPAFMLDEFEALIDADDEDGAVDWLQKNIPHYPRVVAEEIDRLIAESVPWIIRNATRLEETFTSHE